MKINYGLKIPFLKNSTARYQFFLRYMILVRGVAIGTHQKFLMYFSGQMF